MPGRLLVALWWTTGLVAASCGAEPIDRDDGGDVGMDAPSSDTGDRDVPGDAELDASIERPDGDIGPTDGGVDDATLATPSDAAPRDEDASDAPNGCSGLDCSEMTDDCNVGSCDPESGSCERVPVADGSACDDGVTCTATDRCVAGVCRGAPSDDCVAIATPVCGPTGWTCECPSGYAGNGQRIGTGCTDVDECATRPGLCRVGSCTNEIGAYRCTCPAGYRFDGTTCVVG